MPTQPSDLSALSRAGPSDQAEGPTVIPPPARRWKTRLLLPTILLLALVLMLSYAARDALVTGLDVHVVPVVVRNDLASPGTVAVQAPGWVEADPFAVSVTALADGVVREVLALEGQEIAVGQVVARLVDEDAGLALERAKAEVAAHQGKLLQARAAHQAAQRHWDHPIELTRKVSMAEAMVAEKQAELARWPADLAAQNALLIELQAEDDRVARLHQSDQANDIEHVRARQQHEMQKAVVEATLKRKAIIEAQLLGLQADAKAAREHLRLRIPEQQALDQFKAAVEEAEAALRHAVAVRNEAKLRVQRMEVVSPVRGVVMTRLVQPGSKLMLSADMPSSAHVLQLYDPKKLQVRVDVPLGDAALVRVGQEAEIVVDVLPDRVYAGRITRIVHEADVQKNTLQIKVAIAHPSPELKPEMLARVKLLAQEENAERESRQRRFVPADLVQRDAQGRPGVWVVEQSRAKLRSVSVGSVTNGKWVEASEGLRAGDRLIVDHLDELREGRRIRVVDEASGEALK